jgi:hypothetical protein
MPSQHEYSSGENAQLDLTPSSLATIQVDLGMGKGAISLEPPYFSSSEQIAEWYNSIRSTPTQ